MIAILDFKITETLKNLADRRKFSIDSHKSSRYHSLKGIIKLTYWTNRQSYTSHDQVTWNVIFHLQNGKMVPPATTDQKLKRGHNRKTVNSDYLNYWRKATSTRSRLIIKSKLIYLWISIWNQFRHISHQNQSSYE